MQNRLQQNKKVRKFLNKLAPEAATILRIRRASISATGRKAGAKNYSQRNNHEYCVSFIFHLSGYLL